VKETAFSGVFGVVEALRTAGATVRVHDPMFDDDELTAMGFAPYRLGTPVQAAIVQADHPEYRDLGPADMPGLRALVDGRRVVEPARFPEAAIRVLGKPPAPAD